MGDPSGELEFEEESSEANRGKLSWMLNKGLGIGKKVLVTGMVISSAPLVLPPLVVISAIGFACCVPSGVVLASYACSEKLMNKLLPCSSSSSSRAPPLWLEDGTLMPIGEEVEQEDRQRTWVGGKMDIEMDQKWDRGTSERESTDEHIQEEGEMRIEFVEEEEEGHECVGTGSVEEWGEYTQEGDKMNAQDVVVESGYEGDAGESLDMEVKPVMDNTNWEERRFEFVEKGGIEEEEFTQVGSKMNAQDVPEYMVETGEENGYEDDVGESLDMEEKPVSKKKIEGLNENYKDDALLNDEPVGLGALSGLVLNVTDNDGDIGLTPIEVTTVVIEDSEDQEKARDFTEEAELAKETRRLLEKIRDEGNVSKSKIVNQSEAENLIRESKNFDKLEAEQLTEESKKVESKLEAEEPMGKSKKVDKLGAWKRIGKSKKVDKNLQAEKLVGESKKVDNKLGAEKQIGGSKKVDDNLGTEKSLQESKKVENKLEIEKQIGQSKKVDNNVEAEKPIGESKKVVHKLEAEKPIGKRMKADKKLEAEKPVGQSKKAEKKLEGKKLVGGSKKVGSKLVVERPIRESKKVDMLEAEKPMGKSKEVENKSKAEKLIEETKNVSGQKDWHASYETFEGQASDEGADFSELPLSQSAETDTEVAYDEVKLWAQIDAMRSIVGYKGTPHATHLEEVKALYLFTGVEPPASFHDPPLDLAQVHDKLRFLMSIIGVKVD